MQQYKASTFVVICPDAEVWGRSTTLRGALKDAGWQGNLNEFPGGEVRVFLNLQSDEDRVTDSGLQAGEFKAWDAVLGGDDSTGREHPLKAGDFPPPMVTDDGFQIIHNGQLLQVW